jgi:large subunit ribosomal protein L4
MADTKATPIKATTIGKQAKSSVPESVFGEPFNESLIHETVVAEMNARRQGTHSSLTRGEVAMTGAKAWKQKGTGRARVGALSVPHRRGGGAAFGPKPRHYISKVNRKARRKALRSALSVHADRGSLAVLPAGTFDEPKTAKAAEALAKWGGATPTLIVIGADEGAAAKSFRNIERVAVARAEGVGVAEIIGARSVVISEDALSVLESRAGAVARGNGATAAEAVAEAPKAKAPAAKKAAAGKPKAKPAAAKAKAEPKADETDKADEAEQTSDTGGADASGEGE